MIVCMVISEELVVRAGRAFALVAIGVLLCWAVQHLAIGAP